MEETNPGAPAPADDWTDPLAAEPVDKTGESQASPVDESEKMQGSSGDDPVQVVAAKVTELKIVSGFAVKTAEEAVSTNSALLEIKGLEKEIARRKKAELEPIKIAEDAVRSKYRPAEDLLQTAEAVAKGALQRFQREELARIEEENRKAAEIAAAAARRVQQEADEIRRKASEKAEALRAQGKESKAEEVIAAAEDKATGKEAVASMIPAAVSRTAPTKLAGFSSSTRWTGEVSKTRDFLVWLVAQEIELDSIVSFKAAGLNVLANLYKRNRPIPGFVANPVPTSRSGGRRA